MKIFESLFGKNEKQVDNMMIDRIEKAFLEIENAEFDFEKIITDLAAALVHMGYNQAEILSGINQVSKEYFANLPKLKLPPQGKDIINQFMKDIDVANDSAYSVIVEEAFRKLTEAGLEPTVVGTALNYAFFQWYVQSFLPRRKAQVG